jgi:hypothetical protein
MLLVILALMVAPLALCAFAEEQAESKIGLYATINDAMTETEDLGIEFANEDYYSVVVNVNGNYVRIIAGLDEEAKGKLSEATDPDRLADRPILKEEFTTYARTLPVVKVEEIVAQPIQPEVLDAYTNDKDNLPTLNQLKEEGFECSYAFVVKNEDADAGNAVLLVDNGMFAYYITLEVTENEYYNKDSVDKAGELYAEKIELVGLGSHAADLSYASDGSVVQAGLNIWTGFGAIIVQGGDCIE